MEDEVNDAKNNRNDKSLSLIISAGEAMYPLPSLLKTNVLFDLGMPPIQHECFMPATVKQLTRVVNTTLHAIGVTEAQRRHR